MDEHPPESRPLTAMHWSVGSATSFARIVFVIGLFMLWQASQRSYNGVTIIFKLPYNSPEAGPESMMLIWFALGLVFLLFVTAFTALLRSARLQAIDGVAVPAIKHSLMSDLVLTIVGFGFLTGAGISYSEGMTADVVLGTGAGAVVFTGIIGFHYLHQLAISGKS